MRYTDEELKVKNSIILDMERLNLQRLSVTAYALLTRELMKPTEKMGISIPHASLDNIIEGDEDLDNIIDMEQGDVPNENLHCDFPMKHFAWVDLRLKSVMLNAKIMSEKGEIHGKEEFEKASRLAIWMNNLAQPLGLPVNGLGE